MDAAEMARGSVQQWRLRSSPLQRLPTTQKRAAGRAGGPAALGLHGNGHRGTCPRAFCMDAALQTQRCLIYAAPQLLTTHQPPPDRLHCIVLLSLIVMHTMTS